MSTSAAAPKDSGLLIDDYDAALFDLDGVIYLGPSPVPGAAEGIAELRQRGCRLGFVTNNASRSPQVVADHLVQLGISARVEDVVTAAQAGARVLSERLPAGAKVLVIGTESLGAEVRAVGLSVVDRWQDSPDAVIQGYDPRLNWSRLDEAALAIQRGALWLATNTDPTRPTDLGLVPGAGAAVDAVRTAVDVEPEVAGKPGRPLMIETLRRVGAHRGIFVGDRLDTDIAGAVGVGIDSLLVLTGAHGLSDLVAAAPDARPTQLGWDLWALLAPRREAKITASGGSMQATCGSATVALNRGVCRLVDTDANGQEGLAGREPQLDAAWALARLCWRAADEGHDCDPGPVLARLTALR